MAFHSLETRYAGCRFRSRLEARWAVLFDHCDICWEYEPQGFAVTYRLGGDPGTFNYLPDFWLPDLGVWGEVKGELTNDETLRLLNAAACLSSNDGEGCHDSGGNDLAVFGPLTASAPIGQPALLHMHKGDLQATCLWCGAHSPYVVIAQDLGNGCGILPDAGRQLLRGYSCNVHRNVHANAYDAARTARFEFAGRRR